MTVQRNCKPLWWTSPVIPRPGDHGYKRPVLVVEAGLHGIRGNASPYWSVTGMLWASASAKARHCDIYAGGCLHDEIAKAVRWLRPVIALHLSDEDGAPTSAVQNALYWAGVTAWQEPKAETLAAHLRIPEADAEALIGRIAATPDKTDLMTAEVEAMRPRWKAEAEAARALLIEHGAKVS